MSWVVSRQVRCVWLHSSSTAWAGKLDWGWNEKEVLLHYCSINLYFLLNAEYESCCFVFFLCVKSKAFSGETRH